MSHAYFDSHDASAFIHSLDAYLLDAVSSEITSPSLLDPIRYQMESGGSRKRACLAARLSHALNLDDDVVLPLSAIPELLHNASLIHDDIHDGDRFRRGKKSLWNAYNTEVAIIIGDLFISAAYRASANLPNQSIAQALHTIHQTISITIDGQSEDISYQNESIDIVAHYPNIVSRKSGPLLVLCGVLPLIVSGNGSFIPHIQQSLYAYSIAYQIFDDIKDINDDMSTSARQHSLNYVLILEKKGISGAVEKAYSDAYSQLEQAELCAQALPDTCKDILLNEYSAFSREINETYEMLDIKQHG